MLLEKAGAIASVLGAFHFDFASHSEATDDHVHLGAKATVRKSFQIFIGSSARRRGIGVFKLKRSQFEKRIFGERIVHFADFGQIAFGAHTITSRIKTESLIVEVKGS